MIRSFGVISLTLLLTACSWSSNPTAPIVDYSKARGAAPNQYRVHAGDTLYSIAWAYNLDYQQLARLNHLSSPYTIHVGQLIRVKGRSAVAVASKITKKIKNIPAKAIRHWYWPAKGKIIGAFSQKSYGNKGINIKGYLGEPVVAAANGIVVYSGRGVRGYGNLIIVKHNQDYLSAYAFNQRNLVKDGTKVYAGEKIALMGRDSSGSVMLHFEIRRNGRPVNPMQYLR